MSYSKKLFFNYMMMMMKTWMEHHLLHLQWCALSCGNFICILFNKYFEKRKGRKKISRPGCHTRKGNLINLLTTTTTTHNSDEILNLIHAWSIYVKSWWSSSLVDSTATECNIKWVTVWRRASDDESWHEWISLI